MPKIIYQKWANGGKDEHEPTVVLLDNGHVVILSDADTDADGSPDVRSIDPEDGSLQTSLSNDNGWKGKDKYVNARAIPYFVLPEDWYSVTGVKVNFGDLAKLSYKNSSIYAIYADVGPQGIIGEASIAAVESLGTNPWGEDGRIVRGIPFGVSYEIIPGSKNLSVTVSFESIQSYGNELFAATSSLMSEKKIMKLKENAFILMTDNASIFVSFFSGNYDAVRNEVQQWFSPMNKGDAVHNGCVAHQVSCLKLCGLPYPDLKTKAAINVDYFVEWAIANNWSRIDGRNNMEPGDICISGPKSEPNEIDHMYCFVEYAGPDYAKVLHNQKDVIRSLDGVGCGVWRYALRMP